MGVPGYTDQKIYNYISLGQWKCGDVPGNAITSDLIQFLEQQTDKFEPISVEYTMRQRFEYQYLLSEVGNCQLRMVLMPLIAQRNQDSLYFFYFICCLFISMDGIVGQIQHSQRFKFIPIFQYYIKNSLAHLIIRQIDVTNSLQELDHFLKACCCNLICTKLQSFYFVSSPSSMDVLYGFIIQQIALRKIEEISKSILTKFGIYLLWLLQTICLYLWLKGNLIQCQNLLYFWRGLYQQNFTFPSLILQFLGERTVICFGRMLFACFFSVTNFDLFSLLFCWKRLFIYDFT